MSDGIDCPRQSISYKTLPTCQLSLKNSKYCISPRTDKDDLVSANQLNSPYTAEIENGKLLMKIIF